MSKRSKRSKWAKRSKKSKKKPILLIGVLTIAGGAIGKALVGPRNS